MYESQGTADDQTEIWTELFKLIDDDDGQLTAQVCFLMSQKKSGHLNNLQFSFFAQELVSIEESLGVSISETEAKEIIQRYDSDGNNMLSLEEFIFYKESQC